MILSEDKKAEILNNHYRDTCTRLESYRRRRNRLTLYIGLGLIIIFFLQLHPESVVDIIISTLDSKMGTDIKNTPLIIDKLPNNITPDLLIYPFIYMIIFFISVTYKHYTTAIDNQYDYIQILESKLNSYFSESDLFTRETNFSSRQNPIYSMWSNDFYNTLLKYSTNFLLLLVIAQEIRKDGFGGFEIGVAVGWLFALGLVRRNRIRELWMKLKKIFGR